MQKTCLFETIFKKVPRNRPRTFSIEVLEQNVRTSDFFEFRRAKTSYQSK